MKAKLTDEIKEIYTNGKTWLTLEVEYLKLTAAEKAIILMSTMIIGAVLMVLLLPLLIMLLFALAGLFRTFMSPPLAYLSVAGIVVVVICLFYTFRNLLVVTPVSRFITRLIMEKHNDKKS